MHEITNIFDETKHQTMEVRAILIEGTIWILRATLNYIDVILVVLMKLYSSIIVRDTKRPSQKRKVAIVGGSFAGLTVERALSRHSDEFEVTLIDYKTFFEYTPGILRCFVEPSHFKALSCPLAVAGNKTKLVQGKVVGVDVSTPNQASLTLQDGAKIQCDYLVLACGSSYDACPPIKATSKEPSLSQRQAQWNQSSKDLEVARSVLIVGAGAVGVELAAEIATKYKGKYAKRVVLIDPSPNILPGFREGTINYAKRWLERNGVKLMLRTCPKEINETSVQLDDGTTINVDLVYKCFGSTPNSGWLTDGYLATSLKGPKGSVVVNDYLQIQGFKHIFCAGDMCYHERSNELKLAHTAEINAHLVSENVIRLLRSDTTNTSPRLLPYPSGVVGNTVTPVIYDLSLGKYDGSLGFNSLVINGALAAVVKWFLEWIQVAVAEQRYVGVFVWTVVEAVSNFLGRSLIPTRSSESLYSPPTVAARTVSRAGDNTNRHRKSAREQR